MSTKHTPGEWIVGPNCTVLSKLSCEGRTGQAVIARVIYGGRADAELISASKDLLENLKRLVFRIDGVDGAPSIGEMEEARAAIAKAEGSK